MRKKVDRWTQGFACACGIIAKIEGPLEGQSLAKEGGFCKDDFIEGGAEAYDIDLIWPTKQKYVPRGTPTKG